MAHHHKNPRPAYLIMFAVLTVLTAIEVGVAYTPISKGLMASALIMLAVTKAALVGLFYMHLRYETKVLKWSIAIPMLTPALYAVVLMAEAQWRLVVP